MHHNGSGPAGSSVRRVVVAVTGASGSVYARRTLEILRELPGVESHLVVSRSGAATLRHELGWRPSQLAALADVNHSVGDVGAAIASGSYPVAAMLVVPCSIKTLSAIATSYGADLISRAADVTLKEGRPLLLMLRETPLHLGHLRLMTTAAELGAIIAPPVPAMYRLPTSIDDIVDYTVRRALDRVGLATVEDPWLGLAPPSAPPPAAPPPAGPVPTSAPAAPSPAGFVRPTSNRS